MRTTLTLDDDVANLLRKEVRRAGEPMKHTVNRVLRMGLAQASVPHKPKPFKVRPYKLNFPPEWTSGSVQELIEMVEGPSVR
ncbi:MAG: hypothetical protein M3R43_06765 [Acidobacteriota bacterium]|nr:hypothetical protein [Acidobacteriota bacterium]